ncbi:MAG TPA: hypothetical protein VEO19_03095 [Terriglobia bacterium]|nr:hypothetical protein [Terriglobia bacterium]
MRREDWSKRVRTHERRPDYEIDPRTSRNGFGNVLRESIAEKTTLAGQVNSKFSCCMRLTQSKQRAAARNLQRYPGGERITSNGQLREQRNWFQEKKSSRRTHIPRNLDLWAFPGIFFYESGYSIYTLRQASRRSWRIGQRSNVNVKFFYYAGTMQETCPRLMGKKLPVSLAMEGKFASDGLQAIDDGDDILMAMARELVTEKKIGESADFVWKQLQTQQAEVFGVRAAETSTSEVESPPESGREVIIPPVVPILAEVTQLTMFGLSEEAMQRRKVSHRPMRHALPSDQLGLFQD